MRYLTIFSCLLLTTLFACDKRLDFTSGDQLSQEVAFSNKTAALATLTGVYSSAQQDNVLNGTLQLMGEWQSDNVDFVGFFSTFNEIKTYSMLPENISIRAIWDDNYETIGAANLVIKNIPLVEDPTFTTAERANAIAQAKFLRALIYFNISNWWAQPIQVSGGSNPAVPLVLEPFEGIVEFPNRTSLKEVQAQIEQDLLDALSDLDDSDRTRATKGAAQALLARLYLYQERWAEAVDYANQVIQSPNYQLMNDYAFFNTPGPEFVFTLINNTDDGQNSGQGFSGLTNPSPYGRGDAPFSDDLLAIFCCRSRRSSFHKSHARRF